MSKRKKLVIITSIIAVVVLIVALVCLNMNKGNSSEYSVEGVSKVAESSITNETIIFLGSDFTVGSKAKNESFVDFLKKADGVNAVSFSEEGAPIAGKEKATTLVSLLKTIPTRNAMPRLLACELPYADADKHNKLGELAEGYTLDELDTTTIIGAMEYVVCYSRQAWGCPVIFYTCPYNDDKAYEKMVDAMYKVAEKWNSEVIDFYNNDEIRLSLSDDGLYMIDKLNPSRAGYKEIFTPEFEKYLTKFIRPTI